MNASKKVEQYKKNLIETTNENGLPAVVSMMVMRDIYTSLEQIHLTELAKQEEGDSKDG